MSERSLAAAFKAYDSCTLTLLDLLRIIVGEAGPLCHVADGLLTDAVIVGVDKVWRNASSTLWPQQYGLPVQLGCNP